MHYIALHMINTFTPLYSFESLVTVLKSFRYFQISSKYSSNSDYKLFQSFVIKTDNKPLNDNRALNFMFLGGPVIFFYCYFFNAVFLRDVILVIAL